MHSAAGVVVTSYCADTTPNPLLWLQSTI